MQFLKICYNSIQDFLYIFIWFFKDYVVVSIL